MCAEPGNYYSGATEDYRQLTRSPTTTNEEALSSPHLHTLPTAAQLSRPRPISPQAIAFQLHNSFAGTVDRTASDRLFSSFQRTLITLVHAVYPSIRVLTGDGQRDLAPLVETLTP
ncbi:unnamed protein product [Taenia asiatica]|uniref:Uncharacterized protein n=1 Tax=Taenia asiatica TaxID=60517 RepID=A0A0R3VXJ5_TAEAS|nr:unnamed protein product [Taenia asiatica]